MVELSAGAASLTIVITVILLDMNALHVLKVIMNKLLIKIIKIAKNVETNVKDVKMLRFVLNVSLDQVWLMMNVLQ